MEIEIKNGTMNTFAKLKPGDVFVEYPNNSEDSTYLVLCNDYGLGTEETSYDGFAVDLTLGEIYGFYNSDPVVKLDAKLIATLSPLG